MASLPHVLLCALVAVLAWTAVGYPIARAAMPAGWGALATAPALGWAAFNAVALPIFLLIGLTTATITGVAAAALAAALLATLRLARHGPDPSRAAVPAWAFVLAGLAACAPAAAMLPKYVADGVILAAPAFDHSKVAIIDEIARLGVPPGNPTFGEAGQPSRLAYYYLWHFGAATLARPLGVTGWEADIASTWFTAFASLLLIMAAAVWLGGRPSAAWWVVPLSLAGSARPALDAVFGSEAVGRALSSYPGVAGWDVQATWAPQHLASACCVVLAVVVLAELARRRSVGLVLLLALLVTAGFEASAWVGGVTFALVSLPVGLTLLLRLEHERRLPFLVSAAAAAALALALAFPLIADQHAATVARAAGAPVAFRPYEVLGPAVPDALRRWLDLPAFWLVLLAVDLPAVYLAGAVGLATMVARRKAPDAPVAGALASLALASLAVTWLLVSTIVSNDLGWRAVVPGILVATAAAAAALSRWLGTRRRAAVAAALALAALGAPDGAMVVAHNITGRPSPTAAAFARTPALWEAVRRHTGQADRVANNPLSLADATPWPVNVSWALLADRRSCYASWALVRAFAPLPTPRVDGLEALFVRVFAGDAAGDDLRDMATRYGCRLVVLTPGDGAWARDPFAASPLYRLVDDELGRWRLYATTTPPLAP